MSIEVEIQSAPVINASVPPFVVGGGNPYAVLFTEQELSESQMAQARENIGAQESGDYLLAEDLDIVIDDIANMKQDLADIQADLAYKAIDITKFTNSAAGTHEIGTTITEVNLAWELNKTPASQTLDGASIGADVRSKSYTGQSIKANKSYSLAVTDERGATDSASTSISFLNGVYYGVMGNGATINSAAVLALTRKLQGSKGITFTANPGTTQRIAYAFPTRYGTPVFSVGGFEGGFSKAATFDFTNASGYTESYDVWLSDEMNLGSTSVKVS